MINLRQGTALGKGFCVWKHYIIVMLALLMFPLSQGHAQEDRSDSLMNFTTDHPIIFEDAWDLWPYSFLEDGDPTGYSVDVVKMIFEELGIPYEIKLKDSQKALEDLRNGKSDIMMGMKAPFHDDYGQYGKMVINLFTHSVVYVKGQPLPIKDMNDLANNHVIVRNNSFSHHLMQEKGWGDNAIPFNNMKEAVLQVSTEGKGFIVWNTMSLKWLLNQYHVDNLELHPIDIPNGEYRFFSNNPRLLELMDSTYAALRAQDRLQPLQNKWFYPERKETGIPSWIWYIANTLAIFMLCALGYYIFTYLRARQATRNIRRENTRLALTLKASGVRIWTYDIRRQTVTWLDKNGNRKHEYTLLQFFNNYSSHDLEHMMQALNTLTNQQAENIELTLKAPSDTNSKEMCDYVIALSVFHRDNNGKPTVIIGTRNDISQDCQRQKRVRDTLTRYQAIFDSIMVDTVYFDKNGILTDLNDKACDTFCCLRDEIQERKISYNQFYHLQSTDLTINKQESFYATIPLDLPTSDGKSRHIWYELKLQALYDMDDQLLGYYGTGREVTETSKNYHLRQQALQQMNLANKEARIYIDNINYALKVGGMRFASYQPDTHTISIFRGIADIQTRLTQTRGMNLLTKQSRALALRTLNSMDSRSVTHVDVTLKTVLKQEDGLKLFVQFLLVPSFNHDGTIKEYVGVCRDVSAQKNTEEQLEEETVKAQEVETIKNAFLHNMNYEIRTPLNSIVGFAEFFQMSHSTEDEAVFVQEIKENSSMLLKLINNILFLSRIDAGMIEIKTKPTDFALTFDSMCNTCWGNVNKKADNLRFIVENHYKHLVLEIDNQNIGHILEQIILNAIQFTEEGFIRARYDYTGDKLLVSVEDSGCGVNPDLSSHIFDRFSTGANKGTGLGLSICHELVRLMGGDINIQSKEGKGTIVWFAIPCKVLEIERKDIS